MIQGGVALFTLFLCFRDNVISREHQNSLSSLLIEEEVAKTESKVSHELFSIFS